MKMKATNLPDTIIDNQKISYTPNFVYDLPMNLRKAPIMWAILANQVNLLQRKQSLFLSEHPSHGVYVVYSPPFSGFFFRRFTF